MDDATPPGPGRLGVAARMTTDAFALDDARDDEDDVRSP